MGKGNAFVEYNELTLEKIPKDKLVAVFREIDQEICKKMVDRGYSTQQIENALIRKSYGYKNIPVSEKQAYLERNVPRDIENSQNSNKGAYPETRLYELLREEYVTKFQRLFADIDSEIICDLKDRKYSIKNILDAFDQYSPLKYFIHDKKAISRYRNLVLRKSNSSHFKRMYKDTDKASKLYDDLMKSQLGKHTGYTMDNISHVREGSIALSMLMEHHVPFEVIGKVLERKSVFTAKEGPDYVEKILARLKEIKAAYEKIASSNELESATSFSQLYYAAARKYMEKTGTKLLCARDDEKILEDLIKRNLDKEQIASVMAASPVALEIGRQLHEYVKNLSAYYQEYYDTIKAVSIDELKRKAEERFDYYKEYFGRDYTPLNNPELVHSLVAKDLLSQDYNEKIILHIISQAVENRPDKEAYVSDVIDNAVASIKAEQNIKSFSFKSGHSLRMKELNLDPAEIYLLTANSKIADNPSFLRRWNYSSEPDTDILETMLVRYPELNTDTLKDVLMEYSPKTVLSKDREAYVSEVFDNLEKRLALNRISKEKLEAKQAEYAKKCGLATEGTSKDNMMNAYVDGKFAVKLLQDGKSELEVRNAVMMVAETVDTTPASYADSIVSKAKKVVARIKKISNHIPKKELAVAAASGLALMYLDYLAEQYNLKGFLQSRMDIDAFYMMQQKTTAPPEEIREVIKEYSPVYIEPGRNDDYLEYVESNARALYEEELQKLEFYKSIASEYHEDYLTEYAKHQEEISRNINLRYCPEMDDAIAEAMLIQGFSEEEIAKAMETSPCYADESYPAERISKAKEKMVEPEISFEETMVRVTDEFITHNADTGEIIERNVQEHVRHETGPVRAMVRASDADAD